jgi:hypothetical protein
MFETEVQNDRFALPLPAEPLATEPTTDDREDEQAPAPVLCPDRL